MTEIFLHPQSFFYRLLVGPRFRIFRHLLLLLIIGVISFGQTIFSYRILIPVLGNELYGIAVFMAVLYLAVGYLHLYLFVPRLLLKKRYGSYLLGSVLSVGVLGMVDMIIEYSVYLYNDMPLTVNGITCLDSISSFILNMICISGISMVILLKDWITNNQRLTQLENEYIRIEVKQVKEQVNPPLLFNTLSHTALLAKRDPEQTSGILFRLSELLRYQLYDCSREKVLLSSDIEFITTYLILEQFSSGIDYTFRVEGNAGHLFIRPFLLLAFVQEVIQQQQNKPEDLQIEIKIDGNFFKMEVISNKTEIPFHGGFSALRKRLETFYPGKYKLQQKDLTSFRSLQSLELELL